MPTFGILRGRTRYRPHQGDCIGLTVGKRKIASPYFTAKGSAGALYARAPKGERARGSVSRNRGKNTTLIASLSLGGIGAPMRIEGGINAPVFETYVEQMLAPSLRPGQLVVMDNLYSFRKKMIC
jgi:hypothetical protein